MDRDDMSGQIALVTGGGKGIGAAIAVELARRGADVAINYRTDRQAAEATAKRVAAEGRRCVVLPADVSDTHAAVGLVQAVRDHLGPVDLLVNNAAYTRLVPPEQLDLKVWRKMFSANAEAPFHLIWLLRDDLRRSGRGAVVNISSMASMKPDPTMIAYGASKPALNSLTASTALAFAVDGFRVNGVAVGFTKTPRVNTVSADVQQQLLATVPVGRLAEPEEVAKAVAFLLSDESSYVTGHTMVVAGGV